MKEETGMHFVLLLILQKTLRHHSEQCTNRPAIALIKVGKRVRSTSIYHGKQCGIQLKPHRDRLDYSVVCFMMHDCS